MRTLTVLVSLILLLGSASGQNAGRGIEVSDIDRGADPCTDFYAFANGSWRARNPIPASMRRWSRRWAAENGDRLIFLNSKEWLNKSVPILEGKVLVDTLHECENSSEKLL